MVWYCKGPTPQKNNCLVVFHNFFGLGVGGLFFFFFLIFFFFQIKATCNYNLFISQWKYK